MKKGSFKDIIGLKFGKLTVVHYTKHQGGVAWFLCQCDCGNTVKVRGPNLRNGNTKSCGCYLRSGGNIYYHWRKNNYDPEELTHYLSDTSIYGLLFS